MWVRDAGNLLTRAGFTLPGVDVDEYTVKYESALQLIEHLRSMGETSALVQRNNILKKETALATAAVYESMFGAEDGTNISGDLHDRMERSPVSTESQKEGICYGGIISRPSEAIWG